MKHRGSCGGFHTGAGRILLWDVETEPHAKKDLLNLTSGHSVSVLALAKLASKKARERLRNPPPFSFPEGGIAK